MKKLYYATAIAGFLFIGNIGVASAVSVDDVTLSYYAEDGTTLVYKSQADFAFFDLDYDPSSTNDISYGGNDYDWILKSENPEGTGSGTLGDISFDFETLNYDFEEKSGEFSLTWTGSGLPTYLDLVFGFGAGDDMAFYGFNDVYLGITPNAANGTFVMTLTNPSGQNYYDLSHAMVFGRDPGNPVPEPATMLLFGAGLAGLAGVARRKKKA
jgi:hypothetical protein